jgi:hypothetical protein
MIPCSLRTLGECPVHCKDRCSVQPPKAQEAPIAFSSRDKLTVIAFGVVMALLAAGTMHALNHMEKQYQLEARV